MQTDAYFSPADESKKLKVMQGAPFIHEGVVCYWRRKKCPITGEIVRTVEVPVDCLDRFHTRPEAKDMSNG